MESYVIRWDDVCKQQAVDHWLVLGFRISALASSWPTAVAWSLNPRDLQLRDLEKGGDQRWIQQIYERHILTSPYSSVSFIAFGPHALESDSLRPPLQLSAGGTTASDSGGFRFYFWKKGVKLSVIDFWIRILLATLKYCDQLLESSSFSAWIHARAARVEVGQAGDACSGLGAED